MRALPVAGSLSMKTGTPPCWMIGATVVGKPAATVMTSSPGWMRLCSGSLCVVSAEKATRFADEPELTRSECFTPRRPASSFSKASPSGPSVSQKSSVEPTAASTSSSVKTRPA